MDEGEERWGEERWGEESRERREEREDTGDCMGGGKGKGESQAKLGYEKKLAPLSQAE